MNEFLSFVVITANILGSFQDPFEFQGDYGPDVNPIREKVFELMVSKEALARNGSGNIEEAIQADLAHGPTLAEVVTPHLIEQLTQKQKELQNLPNDDLEGLLDYISHYGQNKIFHWMRNCPSSHLSLDKYLKNLPIVGSTTPLEGKNGEELKSHLLQTLFTEDTVKLVKPNLKDFSPFNSPAGQVFFYWLYQSLNLHLISEDPRLIEEVNQVKEIFARTLGNAQNRADTFRKKIIEADARVVFTQEADSLVPEALMKERLFLPIDRQNAQDGTLVFLRSDLWKPDYQVIPIDQYKNGRVNLILATNFAGEKFLLASAHGNSTNAEDGRFQITCIMEKFEELALKHGGLQLIIGIDANTKSEEDVKALQEHLEALGLISTRVGPTTIKKRMVTAQHAKAGRAAIDEEDYLIVLKPEKGGRYLLTHPTVGFSEEKPDIHLPLPNMNNLSDHYPVGATLHVSF